MQFIYAHVASRHITGDTANTRTSIPSFDWSLLGTEDRSEVSRMIASSAEARLVIDMFCSANTGAILGYRFYLVGDSTRFVAVREDELVIIDPVRAVGSPLTREQKLQLIAKGKTPLFSAQEIDGFWLIPTRGELFRAVQEAVAARLAD